MSGDSNLVRPDSAEHMKEYLDQGDLGLTVHNLTQIKSNLLSEQDLDKVQHQMSDPSMTESQSMSKRTDPHDAMKQGFHVSISKKHKPEERQMAKSVGLDGLNMMQKASMKEEIKEDIVVEEFESEQNSGQEAIEEQKKSGSQKIDKQTSQIKDKRSKTQIMQSNKSQKNKVMKDKKKPPLIDNMIMSPTTSPTQQAESKQINKQLKVDTKRKSNMPSKKQYTEILSGSDMHILSGQEDRSDIGGGDRKSNIS